MPSISVVQQYAIPPDQPGGTRHFEFAKVLEKLGWTTQILASDFSHHEKRFFRREARDRHRTLTTNEQGISFVYFWIPEYENNGLRRMVSMMWFSLRVFLRILTKPDDVIYASSPHIFCCASSWMAAKIRRRPFVFEVRDLWPEHFAAVSAGSENGMQYKVMGRIANLLYSRSDLVVIFSRSSIDTVLKRGGSRDRVFLLDGVTTEGLPVRIPSTEPPARPQMVYMGTIGGMYGIQMVLDACIILREAGISNFEITFIGDGPEKVRLQEFVTENNLSNVVFRDPIPKSDVADTLVTFDVGLLLFLPSEHFSYGISPQKLFDYMSVNLPVVSNVQGDLAKVVRDADAGVVSSSATAAALAEAIGEIVDPTKYSPSRFQGGRRYLDEHANRAELTRQISERLMDMAK